MKEDTREVEGLLKREEFVKMEESGEEWLLGVRYLT